VRTAHSDGGRTRRGGHSHAGGGAGWRPSASPRRARLILPPQGGRSSREGDQPLALSGPTRPKWGG
jgi:hypothetical protein